MPDKKYYVNIPGTTEPSVLSEEDFNAKKDKLYSTYPDANVVEMQGYDPSEEVGDSDFFINIPGSSEPTQMSARDFAKKKDKLYAAYPDVQVSRLRRYNNASPTQNPQGADDLARIYGRMEEIQKQLAETPDDEAPAADLRNMSDEDLVKAAANSQTGNAKNRRALNRELEQLRAEREKNPIWQEYWKKTNTDIDESAKRVEQMRHDIDLSNPHSRAVSKFAGLTDRSGLSEMELRKDIESNPEYYRDQEALLAAKTFYGEAKKIASAPSKYGDESGLANYWEGVKKNAADAISVVALAKALNNVPLINAVQSIQEKEGKKVSLIDFASKKMDGADYLSNAQKEMIKAFVTRAQVESGRSDNLSKGYQAGKSAIESVGFMADFLVAGMAGDAAVPKAIGNLVKNTAEDSLARVGAETLYGLVKSAVMTPIMPSTYTNILNGITQLDENGGMDLSGKVILKAGADALIETASETIGSKPLEVLGWGVGKALPTDWLENTAFGNWGKALREGPIFGFMKQAGWNGFFEEMFEEVSGNAVRAWTGVDKDALKNFMQPDQLLITAASFAPMSIVGGIGSTARYGYVRNKYKTSLEDIQKRLTDLGFTPEQVEHITDLGRMSSPKDVADALKPAVDEMMKRGMAPSDIKALTDYAYYASSLNVYNAYESEKVQQQRNATQAELQGEYGDFWQGNEKSGRTVQRVTLPDGRSGFVLNTDETGLMSVRFDDGTYGYTDTAHGAQVDESSLDSYLDSVILTGEQAQDAARMQEEADAARQQFNNNLAQNADVPMGTPERQEIGKLLTQQDPNTGAVTPVRDANGNYIVATMNGQTPISENDLAAKWGIKLQPETREQLDADAVAEYEASKKRVDAYNTIPKGSTVEANLEGLEESVPYQFTRAVYNDETGEVEIKVWDEENQREETLPESAFPDLQQAAAQYSAPQPAAQESVAAEAPAVDNTPRDFRGNPLPMKDDGRVNQGELWEKDPEAWAAWNDQQRQDGGANTRAYIEGAKKDLEKDIATLQKAYANERDFDKRDAIEQEIARKQQRLSSLDSIAKGYETRANEAAKAEKEAGKKRDEAIPAEQSQGELGPEYQVNGAQPAEAQPTPEQQAAAAEEQRRAPLRARAQEWAEKTGVPVEVLERIEDVQDPQAIAAIQRGERATGWFDKNTGKVYLYLPLIRDIDEVDKTYIHEVISHKGLSEMLDGFYNKFLDKVWNELMDDAARKRYTDYILATNPKAKGDALRLAAADEFVAFYSENVDLEEDKTLWDKIVWMVRQFFIEMGMHIEMTQEDLSNLLRASLARYRDIAEKGTATPVFRRQRAIENGVASIEDAAAADEPAIRFNIRTEESVQEKIRNFAKTDEAKKLGWTQEQVENIISETADLMKAINASVSGDKYYDEWKEKNPTTKVDWRDGVEKPIVTWSRANIEYKYDMSADLLCINNEGLETVLSHPTMVDLMLKMNESTKEGFTSDDYLRLYETLRDLGFVVPCKGCFDAAMRLKMLPSVSRKFIDLVNKTIDERNKDPQAFDDALRATAGEDATIAGFPTSSKNKDEAVRVGVAGDNLTEHISWAQLMSAEGQTKALSDWGGIFRAWQRTGAGRPKDKLLPEPWSGEIVSTETTIIGKYGEKTPSYRDINVNQGTGLRRNSHSEFRPILAIDEIQFMREAYLRGLTVFKYMKELDDVRLFGKLGVKFNMSFFPAFVEGCTAAGLDANGDYIAAEESVGGREFEYTGEDGKTHYDGMKGWQEAQKHVNKDVSLSSVVFSIPHLIKCLTDVPTKSKPRGLWGSLIPFHASGSTSNSLEKQGLGKARAIGGAHGFDEAMSDWEKGVTNFEAVQNDRFGEGWEVVDGKRAGTAVEPGHKLEFANGTHYYNKSLGLHLFSSFYIYDSEIKKSMLDKKGNILASKAKAAGHPFVVDYNDKVREIGTDTAYQDAADYYLQTLRDLGLIPRFDFEVEEETYLKACEDAKVDPNDPALGWRGPGNSWSPADSEAYYSLWCDYGMIDPATGKWSPHNPVGIIDEQGNRTFEMPENTVDIVKAGVARYSERKSREEARVDEAIEEFANRSVDAGKISREDADAILAEENAVEQTKTGDQILGEILESIDRKNAEAEQTRFRMALEDDLTNDGYSYGDQAVLDGYGLEAADLSRRDDVVTLHRLVAKKRNQGAGTQFMTDLTEMADKNGWTLALTPSKDFGASSVERLKDFYKRFGFKENKGRNTDFTVNESMLRQPAGDSGIRFSIRGIIGAENANDETAQDNLDVAMEMERSGKDPVTIWRATGWEKGADGKWRNEIPDAKQKEGTSLDEYSTALDVVDAPELFKSYPDLQFTTIQLVDSDSAGAYYSKDNLITMDRGYNTKRSGGKTVLTREGTRTLIHELQHAIQKIEGFAKGGSEKMMETEYYRDVRKNDPVLSNFAWLFSRRNSAVKMRSVGREGVIRQMENFDLSRYNQSDKDAFAAILNRLKGMSGDEYRTLVSKASKVVKNAKDAGKKGYKNLTGEVEARNVEERSRLSEEARRNNPPSTTEDVARKEQTIRFRVANEDQRIFISNAEKAVSDLKMDKATPEQWKKTLEKNGGLKAAEDKWLGLSDWLDGLDRKTITKQEVLEYIDKNRIEIEETRYAEGADRYEEAIASYRQEYEQLVSEGEANGEEAPYVYAYEEMVERYGEDFESGFELDDDTITPIYDYSLGGVSDAARYFLDQRTDSDAPESINITRLGYTTEGLQNKAEIALTVPTIEPWNETDKIHFGDAGDGRAIAWARFGDTFVSSAKDEAERKYREAEKAFKDYRDEIVKKYALQATGTKTTRDLATPEENAKVKELQLEASRLYHEWQYGSHPREKVLVIDEIQSKRHQEAREAGGYKDDSALKKAEKRRDAAKAEYDKYHASLLEKYGDFNGIHDNITPEENAESKRLYREFRDAQNVVTRNGFDPMEDEEYRRLREEQQAHENNPEFKRLMDEWQNEFKRGTELEDVEITVYVDENGKRDFDVYDGISTVRVMIDDNGVVTKSRRRRYEGKTLSELFGEDIAARLMSAKDTDVIENKQREAAQGRLMEIDEQLKPFQKRNFELIQKMQHRENELAEEFNETHKSRIPAAPFEKNWHELAMKRMLRYAAENGYEKVAWTTGEQQADRYSLGGMVSKIEVSPVSDGTREVTIESSGADIYLDVDDQGVIVGQQDNYGENLRGKKLSDVVGKEMAVKIMGVTEDQTIEGDGLRVGGEGMKGFYDDILPRFMNKYGKKWGVNVQDIYLPQLGDTVTFSESGMRGLKMHSVDVTPEMKESVMQGQLMFRRAMYEEEKNEVDNIDTGKLLTYHGTGADFERFDHSHMGEGEGSQVYGWGTYVTTNRDTGVEYAVNLAGNTRPLEEQLQEAEREMETANEDDKWLYEERIKDIREKINAIEGKRHLYSVEIPEDNGENYIHWDDPLTRKQSKKIMDAVRKVADKDAWGDEFEYELQSALGPGTYGRYVEGGLDYFLGNEYNYATDENPGAERNAKLLNSVGIVGIQIPIDRNGGQRYEGSNYVIFNEDDLEIVDHTRFRITPEQDAEYMEAVNAGDMAKAQKMVNDAAALAMPNTKVVDENGKPRVMYHGSIFGGFNVFDTGNEKYPRGAYFTRDKKAATAYANYDDGYYDEERKHQVYSVFLNVENPLMFDADGIAHIGERGFNIREINDMEGSARAIMDAGYDGGIVEEGFDEMAVVFRPSQIKSADPVTRDDQGNVIPLSERFNEGNKDIRFRVATTPEEEESAIRFRAVQDPLKIAELEAGPKVKVYRSMQEIDGKLYPPMSARVDGELRQPTELAVWEESEENPDLADENGNFKLDKGNGKSLKAAYAPYFHSRRSPLNEQFSEAYNRPNLVIVEGEIPESELTSGYTAEKSKKSVGEHDWPSGKVSNALAKKGQDTRKVILSRWFKPVRVVPNSEVADMIMERMGDSNISFPYNVVTPGLREELAKKGARFSGWQGNKPADVDEQIARMQAENMQSAGNTRFRTVVDQNQGVYRGRPFWCGSVNLLDGEIEEVHTYEEAQAAGFHHSNYFSDAQAEKIDEEECGFFWVADGKIEGEWRYSVPKQVLDRVREQIQIRDTAGETRFRVAYHGSPNEFEEFDASFVGDGEGHQAHGWGIYVSLEEGTARRYGYLGDRDKVVYQGQEPPTYYAKELIGTMVMEMANKGMSFEEAKKSILDALNYYEQKRTEAGSYWRNSSFNREIEFFNNLTADDFKLNESHRNLYMVEVPNDNGDNYIDEQKNLKKPLRVRIADALRSLAENVWNSDGKEKSTAERVADRFEKGPVNGEKVYAEIRRGLGSPKAASEFLSNAGFVGIKYTGRADGPCAVIFDADDLKIIDHTRFRTTPPAEDLVKRVQDYGLRGILDEDAAKAFWTDAFAVMPEEARREIVDNAFSADADKQDLNIRREVRKYIAALAKKGYAEDGSGLLRHLADRLKEELGEDLDENTLRYLIWRSANRYNSSIILNVAEDIALRRQLGVGEFSGDRFPSEAEQAVSEAENRIDSAEDEREASRRATRSAVRKTPYAALNSAMSGQRKYDQETVNSIVALAKDMIKKGNIDKVSAREMARLMTIIKDANGRKPATVKNATLQLLDFMVDHTIKKEKELLDNILKVKTAKVREPGVDTIAKLDVKTQNIVNAFRENYQLSEAEIDRAIKALEDNLDDRRFSETSLEDMRSKLEGLQLAKQYAEEIAAKEADIKTVHDMMEYSKAEFDGLTTEEKRQLRTARNEEVAADYEVIRNKKIEEVEAYRRLRGDIAKAIAEGADRAQTFLERERERVEQIHHWANSDMQGVPDDVDDRELKGWSKFINSSFAKFFTAPLANLDQMLRTLGRRTPEGRGYLWNWMMGAVRQASNTEKLGIDAAEKKLNDKVKEIFDEPDMEWNDLYSMERKMPRATMRYFSGNGKWVEKELTQGNLLYIYMVNKMSDGRMKLRKMNISDEKVDEIKKSLDPRFVELADWIQEEFLPSLRDRYNETHKRLFGTSMASIENYFPLRIVGGMVQEKRNVGDQEQRNLPTDITGAIIKRVVNTNQLNIAGTDAFSLVVEHLREMEHWNAYAEASRDFSTLLKYKRFQNQLKQLDTVYGAGQDLLNLFWDTVNLSVGAFRPKTTPTDKAFLNLAKGVTAAKISFRAYTAIKQILSWPAFLADTNPLFLAKNTLPINWKKSWDWAMENLPNFKKRVESRKAGLDILEDTSLDSKFWGTDFAKWINQNGMFMNAFVDALTVSIGARSVYETRKARYLKEGFSEEEADKKAKMDAEVAYNETQQSSEKEFMSTMQAHRTVANVALSAYRNSSMGYQRQLHQAFRTLNRMTRKGYKSEAIEYMTKQLEREGLSAEDAKKAATSRYERAGWQALARVAVFQWLVQFAWNLGSHAVYLLFGDDPDEKKAMLQEDATHALVGGPIEGLAAGNIMSEAFNMIKNGENLRNWDPTTLPIMSDIKNTISKMSSDPVAAWNDLAYLGVQIGLGTNPQTISDAIVAIVDACNGDFETAREVMFCIMRILAVPQSQLDQLMIDEIGMSARDARELSYEDVAKRYVDYKMTRNAPVTEPLYDEELRKKREKSLKTTFKTKVTEREKLKLPKE